jgi:hypothetical protein
MKNSAIMLLVSLLAYATASHAVPPPSNVTLTDAVRCGAGSATSGIQITDVIGDLGGAKECWGLFDGNTPKDSFTLNGVVYNYVAKQNTPGNHEGANIGLSVSPPGGAQSGTWEFNPGALGGANFMLALKASNEYAVWLFSGDAADSFSGDWKVVWGHNLSHMSVYSGGGTEVPIPGTLGLLGLGLLGLLGPRLHRRKS